MLAVKRYLAVSIDLTVSSSSIFRAVSSEGAQKIFGLETWRVMFCSLRLYLLLGTTHQLIATKAHNVNSYLDTVPMTPVQMKMARAALGLGVRELAEKAGIAANTITRIENGSDAKQSTVAALRGALEKAGVEFIAENGGGPGVRIRKSAKGAEEISRQIDALEDKISSIPAPTEPSPEAGMNIMRKAIAKNDLAKLKNRRKRIRSDRSK